jgi:hypothetical protein
VVEDLEEKKPKRGAGCGEANTQTVDNAASRGAKPRSRGFSGVEPDRAGGTRKRTAGKRSASSREDNGKGERVPDEGARLRGERSP